MEKMYHRRLDENWEPMMGHGKDDYLSGVEACGQTIITRLKLFKGEWWENMNEGTPVFQSILGVLGTKKEIIDRILQDRISSSPYVKGISEMQSSYNSSIRTYNFLIKVDTLFGELIVANQGTIDR